VEPALQRNCACPWLKVLIVVRVCVCVCVCMLCSFSHAGVSVLLRVLVLFLPAQMLQASLKTGPSRRQARA